MKEEKKKEENLVGKVVPDNVKKKKLAGVYYLSISLSACRQPGCHGFKVDWHSCQ